MEKMPNDPVMLLSYVNMKLRDFYSSPEALCEALEADVEEIYKKLKSIDYEYDSKMNQFV